MISNSIQQAKKLPVFFAQVREDALIDLHVVQAYAPKDAHVAMIASGGCTVCLLSNYATLFVVDPNPSQLELTRLKLSLRNEPLRMQLLGHKNMSKEDRQKELQKYTFNADLLGGLDFISEHGLDYIGRFEMVFRSLQEHLQKHSIKDAFEEVFSLENLIELFGEKATNNRVQPFSSHFYHQLASKNSAASPYLAQVFHGKFTAQYFPWLEEHADNKASVSYSCATMQEALQNRKEEFHVIHLSNIVDWLSIKEAEDLFDVCFAALKKGGAIVLRQLNSNLEITKLNKKFHWNLPLSKKLLQQERSYFYRNLYIGEK